MVHFFFLHFPLQCFNFTVYCPFQLPQSCDAAMRVRYFPVISLGSGVLPGHGTWPSTSQMHSLRQYFFGPKLAGLDACFLASSSPLNTSLKTEQRGVEGVLCHLERHTTWNWVISIRKMNPCVCKCTKSGQKKGTTNTQTHKYHNPLQWPLVIE